MKRAVDVPRGFIPVAFTALSMAVFAIVFWTFPTVQPGSHSFLNSELLKTYNWVGSYDQRMAHFWSLVSTVVLAFIAFYAVAQKRVHEYPPYRVPSVPLWICVIAEVAVLLIYRYLVPAPIVNVAAILAFLFLLFVLLAPRLRMETIKVLSLLGVGAYLAFVAVPGILANPIAFIAPNGDVLAQVELHLNTLLLPGPGLSAGQNLFKDLPYNYGLLMPSLMSVLDRRYGAMSVGDMARFVQYCQALFAILAAAAYYAYAPRKYLGVAIAILLAASFWSSAHPAIWHPNQSGFRSLTFPLGLLVLALVARFRLQRSDWILGTTGGLLVLINMETAVAVGVGFLVYVGLRDRKLPVARTLWMAVFALVLLALYLVVYRLALGRLPFSTHVSGILATLLAHTTGSFGDRLFSAGPAGENYYIVPFALIMFVHASYVVIQAFYRAGSGPLSSHAALRAAVASVLVVWLSYYFNFPNWWQIWTHLFLYGFLLIDLFDARSFAVGSAGIRKRWSSFFRPRRIRVARLVPLLLLPIMIAHTNLQVFRFTQDFVSPYWINAPHQAEPVSGILMPSDMARELKLKSDTLRALDAKSPGQVLYLTYNVSFIPALSRIFEAVPERNLFSNIAGDDDFVRVMDGVLAQRKQVILIDRADGPLAVSMSRKELQDKIRRAVARDYRLDRTEGGWEVWVRQSQS